MKSSLTIKKSDVLIFNLLTCWLLVDALNGFLLRTGFPISVSQIYKTIVASIVIIRCINNDKIVRITIIMLLYLLLYLANIVLNDEDVGPSIVLLSRLLTSLLFFSYFLSIKRADYYFFQNKAFQIIKFSFFIFAINLILGSMGWGFKAYGGEDTSEGFGSRGFFYSMNELSGVLAVLFAWAFYYCKKNFSKMKYLITSLVLFFLSYTLSTKSGMAATIIFFLFITYFYGNKKEKIIIVVLSLLLLLSVGIVFEMLINSDLPVMIRFNYFINKTDVITALTSSRLEYWADEGQIYYKSGFLSIIFGLGGNKTVEMDPYDALLNCGLVGISFLIFLYVKCIITPIKKINNQNPFSKVVFVSNLLLVIISIGGGHILFSSMAGMLIALSNAFVFGKPQKVICK